MEKAALRIAFTGPESSGKTTMATWCAQEFSLSYIDEFARIYLANQSSYIQEDLDVMAQKQVALWPKKGFVADTEIHVFQVWSQVKYAEVSPMISELLKQQHFDHYFLCAPDIPWEADPLRENPLNREMLFGMYREQLEKYGRNCTILTGNLENRQELIKVSISQLLNP
jgi:nicotinamide riboside kinase